MAGIKDDYDVVVIGAGIGGLTCGALLSRNRMNTLVVEQASSPGGCCSTFTHKGYIFDNGLHFLTGCELGGVIYQTLEDLGLTGVIDFRKLDPVLKIIGKDYEVKVTTPDRLEDKLIEFFPMEAPDIRKFVAECRALADEMRGLSTVSVDSMNIWSKLIFFITFLFKHGGMRKYKGKSLGQVLEKFFEPPKTKKDDGDESERQNSSNSRKLKSILFSSSPYFDAGAMASIPMMLLGTGENCYYPIGGAQIVADVLVEGIRKYYGDIALDTKVDKILIEKNGATGVALSNGRQIHSRFVVSSVDAKQTFLKLVGEDNISEKLKKDMEESRVSRSAFIVSMGVNMNSRAMGFDGTVIVYNPTDDPDELFGNDPDKCMLTITMHSIAEPVRAPGSTTAVQLIAMLSYDAVEDWEAAQEDIANKFVASAEKVIPRLSEKIMFKHIISPLTMEQTTFNSQGACMGWYPAPGSKIRRQKTSIKNLYQAGHWTFPGGGVPAVVASGRNAAELILQNRR